MTSKGIPWRRVAPAIVVAGVLLGVACETPRPAPVAPIDVRPEKASATVVSDESNEKTEPQASDTAGKHMVIVRAFDGTELARYVGDTVKYLPKDGIDKIVSGDKDRCERDECSIVTIILKVGYSLDSLKRLSIPLEEQEVWKVEAKVRDGEKDPIMEAEIVKANNPFFAESGKLRDKPREVAAGEVLVSQVQDSGGALTASNQVASERQNVRLTFREWSPENLNPVPTVYVRSADGTELIRFKVSPTERRKSSLDNLKPDDIDAIEVIKGSACESQRLDCPAIIVTVKQGREAAYRRR